MRVGWIGWEGLGMKYSSELYLLLPEQLLLTVSFQFFSWYNVSGKPVTTIVTLQSFARQNRSKRFLLVTENGSEFRLSFTGRQEEKGTSTNRWTRCVYLKNAASLVRHAWEILNMTITMKYFNSHCPSNPIYSESNLSCRSKCNKPLYRF